MPLVKFRIGDNEIDAEWSESPLATQILKKLPFECSGSYWGGEFYFPIPVKGQSQKTDSDCVEPGTIAFWPAGSCLCIFWGPTPASHGQECRAASPVTVVGRVLNPEILPKLSGRSVRVFLAGSGN